MITSRQILLFQGDSITDGGRDRSQTLPNTADGLGRGYVLHVAAALLGRATGVSLQIFNRGIGGNSIADLMARWQTDCLSLAPTVVSILAGINDVATAARSEEANDARFATEFATRYRELLAKTRQALPGVRVILCEPFALPCGKVQENWISICDARRAIVREIAKDHAMTFVPFQAALNRALAQFGEPTYWAYDGVHPTVAGHGILAQCWLDHVMDAGL